MSSVDQGIPDDEMEFRDNPQRHRFEAWIGNEVAVAEYRLHGSTLTFTHTEVPEKFQGKGVGSRLVKAALDYAREHRYSVAPRCPYVAEYIERHPEYAGLVAGG